MSTLWFFFTKSELENGPVEIVDLPSYKMVDLSSSLCKRLPGRVSPKKYEDLTLQTTASSHQLQGGAPVR